MIDKHSLNPEWYPNNASRNNGPDNLVLERYKLRELAEGWPCYRDSCEWDNFRSLFFPEAQVYTTWSGKVTIDDFIKTSQAGMDNGAMIHHRVHGTTTDIIGNRAVTKMKASITQRFNLNGIEADAESDCRFCFFFEKRGDKWGAVYVRHWYEKDKLIPVNPSKVPALDDELLETFPKGYRYLAYCQTITMNVKVSKSMPGHRSEPSDSEPGKAHDKLYYQCKQWLDGNSIEF